MNREKLLGRGTQLGFIGRMITDLERAIGHFNTGNYNLTFIALLAFGVTFIGVVLVEKAIEKN